MTPYCFEKTVSLSLFHTDLKSSGRSDLSQYQEVTIGGSTIQCRVRVEMEEILENQDLRKQNMEISKKKNKDVLRLNKCSQCNYVSSYKSNLRAHVKTHGGEKSNKCNLCDYASSYASALKTHLKTHSGEKSNKCNLCDYASSQAGHLKTHLKTHSGEKSNKCNLCDFASIQAGSLRTHLKTHSGEK